MPNYKESTNVDKRCTFSSLVTCSSCDHLYAMNDNSKTTLICGAYCKTRKFHLRLNFAISADEANP